jgi:hypothetical protein
MNPMTEKQLRSSFVNASKREAAQAALPDLSALPWADLDYLGWRDRKAPLSAYVVLEVDGAPTGVLLRSSTPGSGSVRRKALCAWCADLTATDDVTLYVARRGGSAGREGNTIGTLICTDFRCSANVRRQPTLAEAGRDEAAAALIVERRISELRQRSRHFVDEILSTR